MKRRIVHTAAALGVAGVALGTMAAPDAGLSVDEHIATVVCHWTPAHDGWYVEIIVDDDGADGNPALEAHYGHENDIINPEGGCDLDLD
jgi:hypothetical protein